MASASPNFGFLGCYNERLLQAAVVAERHVFEDPVTALMRLRQFGELLAEEAAALVGVYTSPHDSQVDLLSRLRDRRVLTREVADIFHDLRKKGNEATHSGVGTRREALHQLRMGRTLAVWFHRSLGNQPNFKAGAFVPPPNPEDEDRVLDGELNRLRDELVRATATAQSSTAVAQKESKLREEAEQARQKAYEELTTALELAEETEEQAVAAKAKWEQRLLEVQAQAQAAPTKDVDAIVERAQTAGEIDQLDLDEAATRKIIDTQLCKAGWETDTEAITYKQGVRPTKGKNLAISEWPTSSGPADYVLFVGLTAIAVVEAKRRQKDVAEAIPQCKRYSKDYVIKGDEQLPEGGPWGEYKIPFLFATNGRRFLRQIKTKSGIWFLDARRSTNHPGPLEGWYTPEGLKKLLDHDHDKAEASLKTEPTHYLGLRDYQLVAVDAVEKNIAAGKRELLLAMATGTGKTRTALGIIYRLLKTKRFRRVLFLVDRTALGKQAEDAFKSVKLENLQSIDEIYDIMGIEDAVPDEDTRLQISTVQGMVKRILYPSDEDHPVPVDRYDCIIVDESHRGYNLDKEMSDEELGFRSQDDYVSKYRRVLDHFDAVRIGLTATPALHTTEIFGPPVHQYSYRQAVMDGYLVDHEPPIRILTQLSENGIHWKIGEEVTVYRSRTGQMELFNTPDEIEIEIEGFNTQVITDSFNKVVCQQLAKEIDPTLPGKTMIFCATDSHADTVVTLLKEAFTEVYGEVEDDAVMKITGAADKPLDKILHYKNEAMPNVAVTVDLLTTGIDVPKITNLVFLRRVRSRILYEQMMGRATRLCPEIGKEFFRIYDAVDLYAALKDYSQMKPVVTRPKLTYQKLVQELGTVKEKAHLDAVVADILVKFHRTKTKLKGTEAATSFETLTGKTPKEFTNILRRRDLGEVREFFNEHQRLASFLDRLKPAKGRDVLVSEHDDEFKATERGYGKAKRPEDYLEGFKKYLEENLNEIPALLVVTKKPRDLTRKQLRELRLALDEAGYSVARLRTAWSETTNQDIAASIIGFIRSQAIGSPLVPYEERVDRAVKAVLTSQKWTTPQRKWLERIGSQLRQEVIVDKAALDRGQFKAKGGFNRLNKIFEGKLESVLGDLHTELWKDIA
ncbi:MAG: type I restriction-modification system endonuclease [Proteobacteria bacterium]|nr:type I restriction-modification system endonuclease [Pseudomonadota bacterium]